MKASNFKTLLVAVSWCASLLLAASARADWGIVTAQEINVTPIAIGDVPPPTPPFYDNTTTTGYYFPPPSGAVPCEVADDVPFSGTYTVTSFTFSYATDQMGTQEVIVKFYGSIDTDYGTPTGTPVKTIDLTGLSGSTDGTLQAYTVTVNLTQMGLAFNWTNSPIAGTPPRN